MESLGNSYEALWKMIHKCRFGMLTTIEESGELRGRPMTLLQKEFDGTLWFIAPADSDGVRAIEDNPNVSLAFADTSDADFVSIAGTASIEFDTERKRLLWNPMVKAWFPQGPESQDVALIKVDANHAEYWDSASNKLVQLYSYAKALATGAPPTDVGEHRTVQL